MYVSIVYGITILFILFDFNFNYNETLLRALSDFVL